MFVHQIDPVIAQVSGVYLWYYGLSYTLGFVAVFAWLSMTRADLRFSSRDVYDATILLMLGVLIGGRLVEVIFYEWDFYGAQPLAIAAYWLGGMSTHGILLGSVIAIFVFCRWRGKSFLDVADALAIPGAFIMGAGRLGNFVDGQIVGAPTDAWWGVLFPDTEGPRHPVVLYDGIKNLLLIPLLLWIRSCNPKPGIITAHFVFWYGFLRIFVDLFREYRVEMFGLGPGQDFNIAMTLLGLGLYFWARRRETPAKNNADWPVESHVGPGIGRRFAFVVLLLFPLIIPSDWTQDVPARYAKRHPGMIHSAIYPEIPERAPAL